jgi:hypothetical protein
MARMMLYAPRMRSITGLLAVVAVVWLGLGSRALAERTQSGTSQVSLEDQLQANRVQAGNRVAAEHQRGKKARKPRRGEPVPQQEVPELDPNAAGLAFVLLASGAMLFADRRRVLLT